MSPGRTGLHPGGDSTDDRAERLRRAAAESLRRRLARADARRAAGERRRHGVALRLAWRQARHDARAADREGPPFDTRTPGRLRRSAE